MEIESSMYFTVRYECGGRLGNCVFPYALCMLYQIFYGYKYTNAPQPNEIQINDTVFLQYFSKEALLKGELPCPPSNLCISGYFQHDYILKPFLERFQKFILENPKQIIHTGCKEQIPCEILIKDYLPTVHLSPKTVVVHLRMEDKIADVIEPNSALFVIHPDAYENVLKQIEYDTIIWVMNSPKQDIEYKYLAYLQQKYGGQYKEQTLEEDVTLMRKAPTLVCSRSSLSWICSAFAYDDQEVYMPERYETWQHETFHSIHPNTKYYSYQKASRKDLESLFT